MSAAQALYAAHGLASEHCNAESFGAQLETSWVGERPLAWYLEHAAGLALPVSGDALRVARVSGERAARARRREAVALEVAASAQYWAAVRAGEVGE